MANTGSLASTYIAFDRNNADIAALAAGAGPLAKLKSFFTGIEVLAAAKNRIHSNVVRRMAPMIRGALAQSYAASGLNDISGDLRRASTTNARVEANVTGIFIGLAKGQDVKVYRRGGVFEYGGIRGTASKGRRRKKEKHALEYLTSQTGQKAAGGATLMKAHPFFDIGGLDIESLYVKFYQEEVDREMKRHV